MKDKKESWIKKLNYAAKKVKATMHEINILNEIIKDVRKYFQRESDFWTNHQVLGMREVFRGVVIKIWVAF